MRLTNISTLFFGVLLAGLIEWDVAKFTDADKVRTEGLEILQSATERAHYWGVDAYGEPVNAVERQNLESAKKLSFMYNSIADTLHNVNGIPSRGVFAMMGLLVSAWLSLSISAEQARAEEQKKSRKHDPKPAPQP